MTRDSKLIFLLALFLWTIQCVGPTFAQDSVPRRKSTPFRPQLPKSAKLNMENGTPGSTHSKSTQSTENNNQNKSAGTLANQSRPTRNSLNSRIPNDSGNGQKNVGQTRLTQPGSRWVERSQGNRGENRVTPTLTRVTQNLSSLPDSAGQVWREYDISPYTSNVQNVDKPEKAVVDWVLQETGTEMWFHQPLGILSADKNRVYVYHTPEIHRQIRPLIDRFVKTRGQVQTIDLKLVTIGNPNWRSQVYSLLQPIKMSSPGVEAWMVSKENAAIMLRALQRRGDFKNHSSGRLTNPDGQKLTLSKRTPFSLYRVCNGFRLNLFFNL